MTWAGPLRVLFAVYVAATALHVGWILAHEPFVFDAWNVAVTTNAEPFSVSRLFEFWWHEYTHSNPRIGQPLTYLAYKLEYFAPVASAIAYLALAVGAFVLGVGRWPAWRCGRDLALVAIAIGSIWFALPEIGRTLFNRAYGANYVYAAAIQLWFLVPLRLVPDGRVPLPHAIAYGVAGLVAGMANEHTGPTLCAFAVGYAWWQGRRAAERPTLAWAGAIGACVGFAAIFFAPGQDERYDGLAHKLTLTGRLLQRGISGNLEIVGDLVLAAAPLLLLIVVVQLVSRREAVVRDAPQDRTPHRLIALALIASLMVAATLFVSPKLGSRFFHLPMTLLLAGFLALADTVLVTPRRLAPFVVLAVLASGYAALRTVPLYQRAARASDVRLAALAAAPANSVFTAESFEQVEPSWWFLGDDLRDVRKRELVARYFGLARVVFRAYDRDALLGVSDVRLAYHCVPVGAPCLTTSDWFEPGAYRGIDLQLQLEALASAIERHARSTPALAQLEVEIAFGGDRPALPRPRLLLARWERGQGVEHHVGRIARPGRSKTREVVAPRSLGGRDGEVFLYEVGGAVTPLGAIATTGARPLRYTPSKNGINWVLACDASACLVFAAAKIGR